MSNPNTSEKSVYLDREEHAHKGEVGAKRVVLYKYDSGTDTLNPFTGPGVAGTDFDYLTVVATDSDTDTLTWKLGGSGGTTVSVLVINYTSSSVDKISDTFSNLSWA